MSINAHFCIRSNQIEREPQDTMGAPFIDERILLSS